MIQAIFLPGFFFAPLNKLLGNWQRASRLKLHDGDVVSAAAMVHHGAKMADCKRRVDLHLIIPKGQRKHDRDAFWKSCLDSLVRCSLLKDDSPNWCKPGSVTYSRAEDELCGTLILLEDLP